MYFFDDKEKDAYFKNEGVKAEELESEEDVLPLDGIEAEEGRG